MARALKTPQVAPPPKAAVPPSRVGKTMVAGYFSRDLVRAIRMLAAERDMTVQALVGEGLDLVLERSGKTPFGER